MTHSFCWFYAVNYYHYECQISQLFASMYYMGLWLTGDKYFMSVSACFAGASLIHIYTIDETNCFAVLYFVDGITFKPHLSMIGWDNLCGISKVPFEIPHKTILPIRALRFTTSYWRVFLKRSLGLMPNCPTATGRWLCNSLVNLWNSQGPHLLWLAFRCRAKHNTESKLAYL